MAVPKLCCYLEIVSLEEDYTLREEHFLSSEVLRVCSQTNTPGEGVLAKSLKNRLVATMELADPRLDAERCWCSVPRSCLPNHHLKARHGAREGWPGTEDVPTGSPWLFRRAQVLAGCGGFPWESSLDAGVSRSCEHFGLELKEQRLVSSDTGRMSVSSVGGFSSP